MSRNESRTTPTPVDTASGNHRAGKNGREPTCPAEGGATALSSHATRRRARCAAHATGSRFVRPSRNGSAATPTRRITRRRTIDVSRDPSGATRRGPSGPERVAAVYGRRTEFRRSVSVAYRMNGTLASGLLDRTSEREALDGLLAQVREGESAVLVIRGEAGIGKTELLRYTARHALGFRAVQVTGVEAEMELPFAGVHQLCAPLLDRLGVLPRPQQDALNVALGLASGDVPDRLLVSLALLGFLSAAAEEQPLLCLVEDAHWLDVASGLILGFVARRVLAESVAIVVAVREPSARQDFDGLPELQLHGLGEEDARTLLVSAVPGRL